MLGDGSAELMDVFIKLFRPNLQSGSSHCLWEDGLTGRSVSGQVTFQAITASVKHGTSKLIIDGDRIFDVNLSVLWTEDKNAGKN